MPVPEIMTMEGKFVRAAFNNEGYAILGYQASNRSIGEEWMLLDFGVSLRDGAPDFTFKRDAVSLETPDGTTLAPADDHRAPGGQHPRDREPGEGPARFDQLLPAECEPGVRRRLLPTSGVPALPRDEIELTDMRACLGRLFFRIPGGIKHGQYWLNVKFANSLVRVPFRILTEEEEKLLSKNYKDISKQVKDAFKKK